MKYAVLLSLQVFMKTVAPVDHSTLKNQVFCIEADCLGMEKEQSVSDGEDDMMTIVTWQMLLRKSITSKNIA
jgi:hypothetical protein